MTEAKTAPAEIENAQQGQPKTVKWTLENPIKRPGGDITEIWLRKPKGGELRGTNAALTQGDWGQVMMILPRISDPFITEQEAEALEAEDIGEAAGIIVGFFFSRSVRAQVDQMKANAGLKT